eukprot:Awhi_evm1s2091
MEESPVSIDGSKRLHHNAVEKKRRETINTGINEIYNMLIESEVLDKNQKISKGNILEK